MAELTVGERRVLFRLARLAIGARFDGSRPSTAAAGVLGEPAGAFVTLRMRGTLRGCIGYASMDLPLTAVVARCAAAAAFEDPRFSPVVREEVGDLEVEISLLGPLESTSRLDQIEIGRHGVVVEHGRRRGLLLPQVAIEHAWDAARIVSAACVKAGLSPEAWRTYGLFRFEAEVFGEDELPATR